MDRARAELSSLESQIGELTRRVVDLAAGFQEAEREDVASELLEVERALRTAARRLEWAVRNAR